MKITFFLISLSLLFVSCTPEPLEIEVPQIKDMPVLASQYYYDTLTAQSAVVVTLSRTIKTTSPNELMTNGETLSVNESYLIGGATVSLNTSSGTIELTELSKGVYYGLNVELLKNEYCSVVAKDHSGNLIASSNTLVMGQVKFSNIYISKEPCGKFINYQIRDNAEEKNWYVVNYLTKQAKDSTPDYNDPKYIARKLTEQKLDFDLFTDADFTGGNLYAKRKLDNMQFDTIAVAVANISEGYFNFLQTQKKYGLLINQLKGEAITFPCNINGGLGYFSLSKPYVEILFDVR